MVYKIMSFFQKISFVAAIQCTILFSVSIGARAELAHGQRGMVASVDKLATQAGIDAMKNGGNAVDAAVAVALTLGVVDGQNSGIGGGCFMLIRRANGEIIALDGREMAPQKATRDMFVRGGKGDTTLSQVGALAVGIPGSVAVYANAVKKYGRRSLAQALLPAAKIAETGFVLDKDDESRLASASTLLKTFPASRAIFFKANGMPFRAGEILKQPDLARSYRALSKQGIGWFYGGDYAKTVDAWMRTHGGIITREDFARYRMIQRAPLFSTYRGYQIIGFPPPSSGGVHVAQTLNILQSFNLPLLDASERAHVVAEAMKMAFADRAFWLGDPDFVRVPLGLLDAKYGESLSKRIDMNRAIALEGHGDPLKFDKGVFAKHTTHFSTADAEGNWVACTATVNLTFGSKVIVPGTGIVLNNQMDDFSTQPGVPNAFGLVGSDANAIAPGKRPLSSMSPTLVLKNSQPLLSLGAAGGPTIITQTVQNLIGVLDLKLPLDVALAQPRLHHQWSPDEVRVEKSLPEPIKNALQAKGHKLDEIETMGVSQMIGRAPDGAGFVGAADARVHNGLALGW